MKKNILIVIGVFTLIALGSFIIFSISSNKEKKTKPEEITTEYFEINNNNSLEAYLSSNFIEKLSKEGASNKEFLDQGVKDYKTEKAVSNTKILKQTDKTAEVKVEVRTTVTNTKTNTKGESTDIYNVKLLLENNEWKISNIEYLESK